MTVFTAEEILSLEKILGDAVEEVGDLAIREARKREPRYGVALAAMLLILDEAERDIKRISKQLTKSLYQQNIRDIDKIVASSGRAREFSLKTGLSKGTFSSGMHRASLRVLSDNPEIGLGPRLSRLIQLLRRNLRKYAQAGESLDLIATQTTLIKKAITDSVLSGATNAQVVSQLKDAFYSTAPKNFFGLSRVNEYTASGALKSLADAPYVQIQTVKGPRRVHVTTHLKTIVRTMGSEIQNRARVNRMRERGIELAQVSPNPAKHGDFCDLYVGRVFSLTPQAQRATGFPMITRTPNGGPPFHVNCLHTLLPFLGDPRDPRYTQTSGSVSTQGGVPTSALDKDWGAVSRWYKKRGGRGFARSVNPGLADQ